MGNCVSPETDETSFAVWNVDDAGNRVQPGRISLTDSQLVFVQKGGEPIRWPLSGLRRYGFDAELFSFESGRRCPTGSGVYAFRCPRAERLFNLLQERIQAQAPGAAAAAASAASSSRPPPQQQPASASSALVDSPPSPVEMRSTADYLEPISIGAQVVSSVHFVSGGSGIGSSSNNHHHHSSATTTAHHGTSAAALAMGVAAIAGGGGGAGAGGPVYQNVPVHHNVQNAAAAAVAISSAVDTAVSLSPVSAVGPHCLPGGGGVPHPSLPPPTAAAGTTTTTTPGVNYVVLDLDHSEPATPTSPTSPLSPQLAATLSTVPGGGGGAASAAATGATVAGVVVPSSPPNSQHSPSPLGYAQIDFDKTLALQQVANRQRSGS